MKIIKLSKETMFKVRMSVFCEAIPDGSRILFVNKFTHMMVSFAGNEYVSDLLAQQMNDGKSVDEMVRVLQIWNQNYVEVIAKLTEEGYFE